MDCVELCISYNSNERMSMAREKLNAIKTIDCQYAVKAQTSWFHGSRVTYIIITHAHQCWGMLYSELCEDCAVANEIDYEIDDA